MKADGPRRHISKTAGPTSAKFGKLTQIGRPDPTGSWKIGTLKSKMADGDKVGEGRWI